MLHLYSCQASKKQLKRQMININVFIQFSYCTLKILCLTSCHTENFSFYVYYTFQGKWISCTIQGHILESIAS